MNIYWEADKYSDNFSFVHKYGEDVLGLITVPECAGSTMKTSGGKAAECVGECAVSPNCSAAAAGNRPFAVDLGCGNGALTRRLADMRFEVLGIDDSAEMLETAAALHPELDFRKGNAVDFKLERKADVIFSNAVFHWIDAASQQELARNIYSQLADGGQLVCEFGGKGCAESIHAALEKIFAERGRLYPRVFYFPTVGEYASILEDAGFRVEEAFLFDRPTPQKGTDGLRDWINMFIKRPFDGIGDADKTAIISEAVERLRPRLFNDGTWFVDYVRIRVKAIKRRDLKLPGKNKTGQD